VAICFEVRINDGPPTITGHADVSVLTAMLTFVSSRNEVELRSGGLVSKGPYDNEHLKWLEQELHVGDIVTIRIVQSELPSAPLSHERQDPSAAETAERAYFERLKKKYDVAGRSPY
jgi:hypothetical protein